VKQAAEKLIDQRYLLEEDLESMLSQAAQHYDLLTSRVSTGGGLGFVYPILNFTPMYRGQTT